MKFEIYCDESCLDVFFNKTAHKYSGIGGIWITAEHRNQLKDRLNEIKKEHKACGELKWKKVSPANINFYKSIIDFYVNSGYIRFRVIIVEADKINLVKFHQSDGELGFYKFYYQLLQHWIYDFNEYDIFVDYKMNRDKKRLITLKNVLSNSNLSSEIKQVQALPSDQSSGIQLADFLTGLVTAKFNNEIKGDSKKELIAYLENKIGYEIRPTRKFEEKLNVFRINIGGGW